MDSVLNSIIFRDIERNKLITLYHKYNNYHITTNTIETLKDKDEIFFCYYWMKYQQKMKLSNLNDFLKSLSIN